MKKLLALAITAFSLQSFGAYENIQTYQDHTDNLKYQEIQGKKIAYIDEGEGEPIVLLHGIPTNSWMYRKMIPSLVSKGYRVIAPDLLGMGQSSKVKNEKLYHVKSQASFILELLSKKLQLKNWTQVVHDMAGPITWEMSESLGFSVKKLVILNTLAFKEGFKPGLNVFTKALVSTGTIKPLQSIFYSAAIKSMISKNYTSIMSKAEKKTMIKGYVTPLKNGASRTYKCMYFQANNIKKEFTRYQKNLVSLKEKGVEFKLIWGKHDKFLLSSTQMPQFQELLSIEDENSLLIENGKHIITEEEPQKIVDFI